MDDTYTQTKLTQKLTSTKPYIYLFLTTMLVLVSLTPIVTSQTVNETYNNTTTVLPVINDNTELSKLLYEREQARFNQAESQSKNVGELNQALKDTMIGRNNALRVMFINPKVNLENKGRATSWRLQFFDEYKNTMKLNPDLLTNGFAHNTERWIHNANPK